MLTLYQYLVQTLLPEQVEKEIQGGAVAAAQRHGRYISPQEGIRTADDLNKLNKVHMMMQDDAEAKQYYLIVYRTLSATICFAVDGKLFNMPEYNPKINLYSSRPIKLQTYLIHCKGDRLVRIGRIG